MNAWAGLWRRAQTQSRLLSWRFGFLGFEEQFDLIQDVKELARRGLSTVPGMVQLELVSGGFDFEIFSVVGELLGGDLGGAVAVFVEDAFGEDAEEHVAIDFLGGRGGAGGFVPALFGKLSQATLPAGVITTS